ncbi:MAG: hypothetical protein M0R80_15665 [Proteobacteria bacterium]|jgi:hypothetical protein|nr:hypothetical protein [Pseudomonadota bacterium]
MKWLSIIVLVAAAAILAAGCDLLPFGKKEEPIVLPTVATPPVPAPVLPTAPVALPVAPVAPVVAVNVPPYTWTETPTLETIPAVPAAGIANGKPMGVASVVFEPGMSAWKLVLSDKALDGPTGLITSGQSVNIDLPEPPAAGKTFTRKMEYGAGYFQINNDPANPEATTSWNADNAWVIEITSWNVKDWDAAGPLFQEAGKASGRIAVCYKGDPASIQSSWIAGTFTDAVVRYMGKPYFLESGAAASGSSSSSSSGGSSAVSKAKKAAEEAAKKGTATEPEPTPEPEPKAEEPKTDPGKPKIDPEAVKKTLGDAYKKFKQKQPAPTE